MIHFCGSWTTFIQNFKTTLSFQPLKIPALSFPCKYWHNAYSSVLSYRCGTFSATSIFLCRQEVMDLVTKSGKFSKKFEAFTGWLLRPSLIFFTLILLFITMIFIANPFFALWHPETYTLSHVMIFQALVIPWVRDWTTQKLARNWDGSQDTQVLLIFLDYLSNCCVYLHCWF